MKEEYAGEEIEGEENKDEEFEFMGESDDVKILKEIIETIGAKLKIII